MAMPSQASSFFLFTRISTYSTYMQPHIYKYLRLRWKKFFLLYTWFANDELVQTTTILTIQKDIPHTVTLAHKSTNIQRHMCVNTITKNDGLNCWILYLDRGRDEREVTHSSILSLYLISTLYSTPFLLLHTHKHTHILTFKASNTIHLWLSSPE